MYRVELSGSALKHLIKIETRYKKLIARSIDALHTEPRLGIPLKGKLGGLWKLRVAQYRIIYKIVDSKLLIFIVDVDHRKQVYR